ncbi:MAG: ribonuclease III [Actinobacteria bacterium]|nr:MAG: ribonuclease III [Actinomycetota bacterium]
MKKIDNRLALAQKKLKVTFNNQDLLVEALTHRSYLAENPKKEITNEKLEFLGDAVLDLVVTDFIYNNYRKLSEGDLAKLRANIVNAEVLATIAKKLKIGEYIVLGKGAEHTGRKTDSILGDAVEAIIGAIYLDQGIDKSNDFIIKNFKSIIKSKYKLKDYSDPKTALQERAILKTSQMPIYKIVKEKGPYHDRTFHAEVFIGDKMLASGEGKSKKKAEQQAAAKALRLKSL